jgi:hypothetical protein
MFGLAWLRKKHKEEIKTQDMLAITASDFTIQVSGFPSTCASLKSIKEFFEKVATTQQQKLLNPETAEENAHLHDTLHDACVMEITVATTNVALLQSYRRRALLNRIYLRELAKAKKAMNSKKMQAEVSGENLSSSDLNSKMFASNSGLRKAKKNLDRCDADVERLSGDGQSNFNCAFVTFDEWEHCQNVLAAYRGVFQGYWCSEPWLRFEGKRLTVRRAPEPSNILWENFGVHKVLLLLRRSVAVIFSLVVLVIGAVMMFVVNRMQASDPPAVGDSCPIVVCDGLLHASGVFNTTAGDFALSEIGACNHGGLTAVHDMKSCEQAAIQLQLGDTTGQPHLA